MNCLIRILATLVLFSSVGVTSETAETWTVSKIALAPKTEFARTLNAVASPAGGKPKRISFDVVLSAVTEHFVLGDKLVVLGNAGRAQAVVVYDLRRQRETDWFYCYYPQRVSHDLIAYVEFYPIRGSNPPKDVVLIYDLNKGPYENRLVGTPMPVPRLDRVKVGVPIFPVSNFAQRSYVNAAQGDAPDTMVLPHTFLLMSRERLVFVGVEGSDAQDYRSHLVVVDLSRDPGPSAVQRVELPIQQLGSLAANPNFVVATKLENAGENSVRLLLQSGRYKVPSIVVNLRQP